MKKIKLAVITRDENYLQRLVDRLHGEKDINLLSVIIIKDLKSEVKQAIAFVKQTIERRTDILLLDQIILRDAAAMDLQQTIDYWDILKATKVIIVGERYNEDNVVAMIEGGARGFFRSVLDDKNIIKCISAVARGEFWLDAKLTTQVLEAFIKELKKNKDHLKSLTPLRMTKLEMLSPREMEVLAQISESMTNEEIGVKLFLSPKTVKTHLRNIFEKAGIRNRVEAALIYTRYVLMSH